MKNTQKNIKMIKKIKNQIQRNKKQNKRANIVKRIKIIRVMLKNPNNIVKMITMMMKMKPIMKIKVTMEVMVENEEEKKEN